MKDATFSAKKSSFENVKFVLPNTISEKMTAIVELSKAINSIAEALKSTNVNLDIKNCTFSEGIDLNLEDK